MSNPWLYEFWRVTLLLLLVLFAGLLIGHYLLLLLIVTLIYITWHLRHIYLLERWLRARKSAEPPDTTGIWGEIFNHIHRLQNHNRSRKRKLALMITRFQEAAMAMPDATVILTTQWEMEWINSAAKRLLGLRSPHDIGHSLANFIRNPLFHQYLLASDYSEPLEIPSPIDDNIILSLRIVPYGQERQLLLARDVTRIQRLEEVRRHFVANVSHELSTPLTIFKGYLEMLLSTEEAHNKTWEKPLTEMQQQSRRMEGIVEDLLLISRLETRRQPLEKTSISIPMLLKQLEKEALMLSGENNHIILFDVDQSLWLYGSENEIKSAFSNLISNAIRYTPAGKNINVKWYQDQQGAHLSIQDSGVGIAAHHIPKLTERFYRVDTARSRETGGTGLGLAIVKHVLNHHHAELTILSTVGQGSTFSCTFPSANICPAESHEVLS